METTKKMSASLKHKLKIAIILSVEFIAVAIVLLLIFLAGKKSYTVTFDLNGGTLISGDLEQTVRMGNSATPPAVAKDGCYLHGWSASTHQVTRDMVVKAIWEYESTVGIEYNDDSGDSNYCQITGSYEYLYGDVYIGAYHNNLKVLGVLDDAFYNRSGIEKIFMLDGIISIGNNVFAECKGLESIVLPSTLKRLGEGAFKNCSSLETIILPEGLEYIGEGAFEGCTSLTKVVMPKELVAVSRDMFKGCSELVEIELYEGLEYIGEGAFAGCGSLTEIVIPSTVTHIGEGAFDTEGLTVSSYEDNRPDGWSEGWASQNVTVVWGLELPPEEDANTDSPDED